MELIDYTAYRNFAGSKFRLKVAYSFGELHVNAKERGSRVGELSGQYCESVYDVIGADAVDCRGPEVFEKIQSLHDALEMVPFLYLGGMEGEGKGRKIGHLLLQEVSRAIRRMDNDERPAICWYAYPEKPIPYTGENITRLITFYRHIGAINPCKDRQVMIWDPWYALDRWDIQLQDLGPERKRRRQIELNSSSAAPAIYFPTFS